MDGISYIKHSLCRIDRDVSDPSTKVYGDCSAILIICLFFFRLKRSSSYTGAAVNK